MRVKSTSASKERFSATVPTSKLEWNPDGEPPGASPSRSLKTRCRRAMPLEYRLGDIGSPNINTPSVSAPSVSEDKGI